MEQNHTILNTRMYEKNPTQNSTIIFNYLLLNFFFCHFCFIHHDGLSNAYLFNK